MLLYCEIIITQRNPSKGLSPWDPTSKGPIQVPSPQTDPSPREPERAKSTNPGCVVSIEISISILNLVLITSLFIFGRCANSCAPRSCGRCVNSCAPPSWVPAAPPSCGRCVNSFAPPSWVPAAPPSMRFLWDPATPAAPPSWVPAAVTRVLQNYRHINELITLLLNYCLLPAYQGLRFLNNNTVAI